MRGLLSAAFSLLLALPATGTGAAGIEVDLELVLAVDVSRSMDVDEQQLQRQGYAAAIRHPDVIKAIQGGLRGRIAVTYLEWSDADLRRVVVPWRLIAGRSDAEAFAAALSSETIARGAGTSVSGAMMFSAIQLNASPFVGDRRTVDISGDGPNNSGVPVEWARDLLVRRGVTINGLPIMVKTIYSYEPFVMTDLDAYYAHCVIGGPGAFMIVVRDMANFGTAVRSKLQLEVAGAEPRVVPAAMRIAETGEPADCLAGENARRRRLMMFE